MHCHCHIDWLVFIQQVHGEAVLVLSQISFSESVEVDGQYTTSNNQYIIELGKI